MFEQVGLAFKLWKKTLNPLDACDYEFPLHSQLSICKFPSDNCRFGTLLIHYLYHIILFYMPDKLVPIFSISSNYI